jgi:hypothetical protein
MNDRGGRTPELLARGSKGQGISKAGVGGNHVFKLLRMRLQLQQWSGFLRRGWSVARAVGRK